MIKIRNLIKNVKFTFLFFAHEKRVCWLYAVNALISAILPFFYVFLPKILINTVSGAKEITGVFGVILGLCAGFFLAEIAITFIKHAFTVEAKAFEQRLYQLIAERSTRISYEQLEGSDVQDDLQQIKKMAQEGTFLDIMTSGYSILSGIISLAGMTAILFQLEWYIVLLIVAFVILNGFAGAKSQSADYRFMLKTRDINRKVSYVSKLMTDYVYGKEIRVYQLADYVTEKYKKLRKEFYVQRSGLAGYYVGVQGVAGITGFIQRIVVYFCLIRKYFFGGITLGDFSGLIVATEQSGKIFSNIIQSSQNIRIQIKQVDVLRRFLEMSDTADVAKEWVSCPQAIETIEFRNVSYQYAGQDGYVLDNISFTIDGRKKYAIVGENGAGKTTLIKLLLRLYKPSKGAIFLNGIEVEKIPLSDYLRLFSAVFQDYVLFSLSIMDNLTLDTLPIQENALSQSLAQSGFEKALHKMPHGLSTFINRDYDPEGVSMSVGEQQQLAITRGILRNSPILVLDEPASALSPLAEASLYKTLGEVSENKCVIFISHRLASTRLCDMIFLIGNGSILENGSHEQLMQQNQKYAKLFHLQADPYQEKGGEAVEKSMA